MHCLYGFDDGPESNRSHILLKYHYSAGYQHKSLSILIVFYNTADFRFILIQIGNKQECISESEAINCLEVSFLLHVDSSSSHYTI